MTVFNPVRIRRKIKQSGITNTALTGWESIYVDKLLKKYYLEHGEYNVSEEIINRSELQNQSDQYWNLTNEENSGQIPIRSVLSTDERFDNAPTRLLAQPAVYEFRQGWLLGPSGLGFTGDNRAIAETVGLPPAGKRRVAVALARAGHKHGIRWLNNKLQTKVSGSTKPDVAIATAIIPLWKNYYHWMIECLPRLRYIQHYRETTGREPIVFIPESRSVWMEEALKLVNLDMDYRIITQKSVSTDRLIVPVHPDPSSEDIAWLKSRILENESPDASPQCIYISRNDATSRRVKNIEQINSILREFNIKKYELNEYTVQEQARLFAGADLVIAPHGAGLANLVFCEKDTSVVELFGDNMKTSYYRICKTAGMRYYYISGRFDGADIVIDPNILRDRIENILY